MRLNLVLRTTSSQLQATRTYAPFDLNPPPLHLFAQDLFLHRHIQVSSFPLRLRSALVPVPACARPSISLKLVLRGSCSQDSCRLPYAYRRSSREIAGFSHKNAHPRCAVLRARRIGATHVHRCGRRKVEYSRTIAGAARLKRAAYQWTELLVCRKYSRGALREPRASPIVVAAGVDRSVQLRDFFVATRV